MTNVKTDYSKYWRTTSSSYSDSSLNKHKEDPFALMSLKNGIKGFVFILTGLKLPVEFEDGDDSFTDGERITLSNDMENIDAVCGVALHESAHVLKTNFKVFKRFINDSTRIEKDYQDLIPEIKRKYYMSKMAAISHIQEKLKMLFNIFEDRRIDDFVFTTVPGFRPYYRAFYEKYFTNKKIGEMLQSENGRDNVWRSYEFRICNITNPDSDITALPKLKLISDKLDLQNINRFKTSDEIAKLSDEVFRIIETSVDSHIKVEGLPEGLTFEDGYVRGTPKESGKFTVTVTMGTQIYESNLDIEEYVVSNDDNRTKDTDIETTAVAFDISDLKLTNVN